MLAACTEEEGKITRQFASPEMRKVNEQICAWMRDAGMKVRIDSIGNVVGRFGDGDRTLLFGSHLDTVRDAGKYDGPLGVLVALAAVEGLAKGKKRLPFAIEVLGFADEEGLRYQTTYLGSRVVAGTFDARALTLRDADGVLMADAIRAFGGDPEKLAGERRDPHKLIGYCEVHIEQGPVLEARGLALGIVSAITGQSRIAVELTGEAGHAGTLPMDHRRDALAAAAELVLDVERLARSRQGLVATVGKIDAAPGASNVVPGHASMTIDVRHPDNETRRQAVETLHERASRIAGSRHVAMDWKLMHDSPSMRSDTKLSQKLARAVASLGVPPCCLTSGAGHDAAAMGELTGIAMLFVRCRGGVSHSPDELASLPDVSLAIEALDRFIELVAEDAPGD